MFDNKTALDLVKARLNRLKNDTSLDEYLTARIEAAVGEIELKGIHLTDQTADMILVVDYTVYQYSARDKDGGMPEWLRLRIRERWLNERGAVDDP